MEEEGKEEDGNEEEGGGGGEMTWRKFLRAIRQGSKESSTEGAGGEDRMPSIVVKKF